MIYHKAWVFIFYFIPALVGSFDFGFESTQHVTWKRVLFRAIFWLHEILQSFFSHNFSGSLFYFPYSLLWQLPITTLGVLAYIISIKYPRYSLSHGISAVSFRCSHPSSWIRLFCRNYGCYPCSWLLATILFSPWFVVSCWIRRVRPCLFPMWTRRKMNTSTFFYAAATCIVLRLYNHPFIFCSSLLPSFVTDMYVNLCWLFGFHIPSTSD